MLVYKNGYIELKPIVELDYQDKNWEDLWLNKHSLEIKRLRSHNYKLQDRFG